MRRLRDFILDDPSISRCICTNPTTNCEESGKITCSGSTRSFIHVRFDPCMCQEATAKRCDCVIFCFDQSMKKQAMFVIEVKRSYNKPSLEEIRAKLQYCIGVMQAILRGRMAMVEIFPMLCSRKHSAFHAQVAMTKYPKVKCYGTPKSIVLNPYAKNISSYFK